ncbi:MAG: DUF1624 domain-containing protein, partial [Gemmatimonadales bacterium]
RLDSVDLLRGLVMVIMALDHVRDYFNGPRFDPLDLTQTTAALFFTRWITHFCAPVFVFLAGAGAFISGDRGKPKAELSRFLVTRGLWLVALEVTVVRFAWAFNLDYGRITILQVIWAIGWSMVALAALIHLPHRAIAAFAIVMILGHNLLDPILPEVFGGHGPTGYGVLGWLWIVLHVPVQPVFYPLIPWIGVMAAGYAFGPLLRLEAGQRRRTLLTLGVALTAGFIVLRAIDTYGDPTYWTPQRNGLFTLLSFVNTTKYPPSLLFLLMILGPAIAALALFERISGPVARFFIVFGRVPLFYYVLHLYLIHLLVLALAALQGLEVQRFLDVFIFFPPEWGFSLPVVYLIWAAVVLTLYPACRWFAGVKQRNRSAWLSYL